MQIRYRESFNCLTCLQHSGFALFSLLHLTKKTSLKEHYCLLVCNCLLCPQSMEALEYEVKALHVALEQIQATLTSPELARQSLKEQLAQRQVTTSHGEKSIKHLKCSLLLLCCEQFHQTELFPVVAAAVGRYGELQAAGAGGAAVSERSAGPRGSDAQPRHLSHGTSSAARSQSLTARGHSAMQHPPGTAGALLQRHSNS